MEEWKVKLLAKIERDYGNELERMGRRRDRLLKVKQMKIKLAEQLRSEPMNLFGDEQIYLETAHFEHAHDVAKALHVRLNKGAESDGVNYRGKVDNVRVNVYGPETIPRCRIVREEKEVTHTEVTYKLVCK